MEYAEGINCLTYTFKPDLIDKVRSKFKIYDTHRDLPSKRINYIFSIPKDIAARNDQAILIGVPMPLLLHCNQIVLLKSLVRHAILEELFIPDKYISSIHPLIVHVGHSTEHGVSWESIWEKRWPTKFEPKDEFTCM